jgi:uncharacterized protein YukE
VVAEPNWDNVRFDHGAASAAMEQCDAAVGRLNGFKEVHGPAQTQATGPDTWKGTHRETFDSDVTALVGDVDDCIQNLNDLKSAIASAKQEATEEQERRETARDAWCAENPDDDRCRNR